MERELVRQIALGTTKLTSFVDATPDIGDEGLLGIMIAKKLQEKYRDRIDFLIATSPIFGFKKNDDGGRWSTYLKASHYSDVLG
jgi:hypothetical protein